MQPNHPTPATFRVEGMTVKSVGALKVISDKFSRRDVILTDGDEKYPQNLLVQFQNKEAGLCDLIREGDLVDVAGELRGREYNGRYYVDVVAHEIHRAEKPAEPATKQAQPAGTPSALPF